MFLTQIRFASGSQRRSLEEMKVDRVRRARQRELKFCEKVISDNESGSTRKNEEKLR